MHNDLNFDRLAEEKQYVYHRRHFAATRNIMGTMDKARANIIRDLSRYTPPNVYDPSTWLRLNANGDTLANLRKKAMQLPEPERSQWLAKLNKPSWRAQITNKSALYSRLLMEGVTTKATIDETLREQLAGAAKEGFTRQMFEIQKGVGMGWAFDLPNTRQADALVRRVFKTQYTENLTKDQTDKLMEKITAGIISGKSEKDIAKDIHESDPEEIWKAKRLVRTELTAAAAEGELLALKEVGIERYRFYATLDERACMKCGVLDLQDFALEEKQEGFNFPPMHPNCRCVIQAVLEGDKVEEIVRSGRNEFGKTDRMEAGMTFSQWYDKYVLPEKSVNTKALANDMGSFVYSADAATGTTTTTTTGHGNATLTETASFRYNLTPNQIKEQYQYPENDRLLKEYREKHSDVEKYSGENLKEEMDNLRKTDPTDPKIEWYDRYEHLIEHPPQPEFADTPSYRQVTSDEKLKEMVDSQKLTEEQWDEVKKYTDGASPWNDGLKEIHSSYDPIEAERLTDAINAAELDEGLVVWSGQDIRNYLDMEPGDIMRVNPFMSTSTEKDFAVDVAEYRNMSGVGGVMRIELPAGKGIALPIGERSNLPDQKEILMQRGLQFQYLGTAELYKGMPVMRFRVIGQ